MIFRETYGILQEVIIPIYNLISGCNSDKKFIFFKKKVATLCHKVSVSASEEKEMRVLAPALTLTLFQYPERTKVATWLSTLRS
jgi:hypothetical protein